MIVFEGGPLTEVTRSGWGARQAHGRPVKVAATRRREFIVHHSGGPALQSVRSIQDWCMDGRGFNDIDYNFLVGQDGHLYVGRGWNVVGSHTVGHNTTGIGVCVIGDNQLGAAARPALRWLYGEACRRAGRTLAIHPHSACASTDCPGDVIRAWLAHGWLTPRTLRYDGGHVLRGDDVRDVQHVTGAADDGLFGPATRAAVSRWQQRHGLDADGVVGPLTRRAMGL